MGHSIPTPYGRVFMNLMIARSKGLITFEQGHKTWIAVSKAWERNDPESYNK